MATPHERCAGLLTCLHDLLLRASMQDGPQGDFCPLGQPGKACSVPSSQCFFGLALQNRRSIMVGSGRQPCRVWFCEAIDKHQP
jgi:hypothetical protein